MIVPVCLSVSVSCECEPSRCFLPHPFSSFREQEAHCSHRNRTIGATAVMVGRATQLNLRVGRTDGKDSLVGVEEAKMKEKAVENGKPKKDAYTQTQAAQGAGGKYGMSHEDSLQRGRKCVGGITSMKK